MTFIYQPRAIRNRRQQSGDYYKASVVLPHELVDTYLAAAERGDADAIAIATGIGRWLNAIEAGAAAGCLHCEEPFLGSDNVEAFAVITPLYDPALVMTSGICRACVEGSNDLLALAVRHLSELWDEVTVCSPPAVGRA